MKIDLYHLILAAAVIFLWYRSRAGGGITTTVLSELGKSPVSGALVQTLLHRWLNPPGPPAPPAPLPSIMAPPSPPPAPLTPGASA